jgi:hypothetical protein
MSRNIQLSKKELETILVWCETRFWTDNIEFELALEEKLKQELKLLEKEVKRNERRAKRSRTRKS